MLDDPPKAPIPENLDRIRRKGRTGLRSPTAPLLLRNQTDLVSRSDVLLPETGWVQKTHPNVLRASEFSQSWQSA